MRRPFIPFVVVALLVSILVMPRNEANAQVITLPAEINKGFSPLSIPSGGVSRLSVTVYNPNLFELTNASWTIQREGCEPSPLGPLPPR